MFRRRRAPTSPHSSFSSIEDVVAPRPKRFRRIRAWYARQKRPVRVGIKIFSVLALIMLIYALILLVLIYKSLAEDDLALFFTVDKDTVTLTHGGHATVTASLGARNLPFCSARCTWSATDRASGLVIENGSLSPPVAGTSDFIVTIPAAPAGERSSFVTIDVACRDDPVGACKSSGTMRYTSASVRVHTTFTPDETVIRNGIALALPSWNANTSALLLALGGISDLTDARAVALVFGAKNARASILAATAGARTALEHEDFSAHSDALVVAAPPISDAACVTDSYGALVLDERAAVETFNTQVLPSRASAYALLSLLTPEDLSFFTDAAARARTAHDGFNATAPHTANESFTYYLSALNGLQRQYRPALANRTLVLHDAILAEEARICMLTNATCSALDNMTNQTLLTLPSFDVVFAQRDALCLRADAMPLFAQHALVAYNATLNASANLSAWLVAAAAPSPAFLSIAHDVCVPMNRSLDLPTAPLVATLPEQPVPLAPVPDVTLSLVPPQCCANTVCAACPAAHKTAVLFVHGFSFAQGTTPEMNLNTFGPLSAEFSRATDPIIYLGHVFPQSSDIALDTSASGLPGRWSVTTTYYYDSYQSSGKTALVTQKSENLETYAIRLREAIAAAKAKTGSDRVIIVTHSMGGLVTRRYLQLFGDQDVAAVIMMGTPNNGTTGRTEQLCGVLGAGRECSDMTRGSIFLQKLNSVPAPTTPFYTIAGVGCEKPGEVPTDGVIEMPSVALPWAQPFIVNGTCSGEDVLHISMLEPSRHPEVASYVRSIIEKY